MEETTIWLLVILICGPLYLILIYFDRNEHLARLKLTDFLDSDHDGNIVNMINFLSEQYGVKPPKYRRADLSKQTASYDKTIRLYGLYLTGQKMILIDVNHLKEIGFTMKKLAEVVAHEWQHYVDDLNGINYDTVGSDLCEARARKFEKKGSREIIRSWVME